MTLQGPCKENTSAANELVHVRLQLSLPPILLTLGIALAGCDRASPGSSNGGGFGSGASNKVNMDPTNFTQHTITVAINQPVHFSDNTDNGGVHILNVGTGNGGANTCSKSGNAPSGLLGTGTMFNPGEAKHFTFTNPAPTTSSAQFIQMCISTSR